MRRLVHAFVAALPLAACGLDIAGTEPSDHGTAPGAGRGASPDAGPVADAAGAVAVPDAGSPVSDSAPGTDTGSDAAPVALPRSCADLALPGAGPHTLYLDGDSKKPWTAHCVNGLTYLVLPSPATNVSIYPDGGCASGTVTTTWSMVRFDPATRIVDTSDFTGASSTGSAYEVSGNDTYHHTYTRIPYGAARTCVDQADAATARIDLNGTSFAVDPSTSWRAQGWSNATPNNAPLSSTSVNGKAAKVTVGGYPGGISCTDDFYTTNGGPCLKLQYAP